MKFIRGYDGPWHVGEERTSQDGERKYIVSACRGQQLGGPWGHRTWKHTDNPPWRDTCKHCQKLLNRERDQ